MAFVLGFDIPILEFLLVLNVMMLIYIIISMFEIRNLIKLNKSLQSLMKESKPAEQAPPASNNPKPEEQAMPASNYNLKPEDTFQQPKS